MAVRPLGNASALMQHVNAEVASLDFVISQVRVEEARHLLSMSGSGAHDDSDDSGSVPPPLEDPILLNPSNVPPPGSFTRELRARPGAQTLGDQPNPSTVQDLLACTQSRTSPVFFQIRSEQASVRT
jgi:hypothetical protein